MFVRLVVAGLLLLAVMASMANFYGDSHYEAAEQAIEEVVGQVVDSIKSSAPRERIMKTDKEWRALLTKEQYYVTRKKGTERPWTGEYADHKGDGVYRCVCCGLPLFDSTTKYESGTGWPSFYDVVGEGNVAEKEDRSWWATRTEVLCNRCDAHLGHVFPDGPRPTGRRYCINSAALKFDEQRDVAHETDTGKAGDDALGDEATDDEARREE